MLKNRFTRLITCILFLLVASVLIAGCAPAEQPVVEQPAQPGQPEQVVEAEQVIRKREVSDPNSFDPLHAFGFTDPSMLNKIYESLLKFNPETLELEPSLAVSWDVNADATVYTFRLREGVRWHGNYGYFTADDVKFHYERLLDPDKGSRHRPLVADVIDRIEVVNTHEVVFYLQKPFAAFPYLIANGMILGFITSRAAYEDLGEKMKEQPIGTGPFKLESHEPRVRWTMVRNDDYWGGAPELDRIVSIPILEDFSARAAMIRDELDIDWVRSPEEKQLYLQVPGVELVTRPQLQTLIYFLNPNIEPLDDVRVRRAIMHALNREEIRQVAFGDLAKVAHSVIPPGTKGYIPAFEIYDYNPEKAKALLAEAGYPDGFTLKGTFFATSVQKTVWTLMQSQLKQVGIDLVLDPVERAAWDAANRSGKNPFGYWPTVRPPDPHFVFDWWFHSKNFPPGGNAAFYAGVDDLIDKAGAIVDWSEREPIYHEIQRRIAEDVPYIPLLHEINAYAVRDTVEGVEFINLQPVLMDFSRASHRR